MNDKDKSAAAEPRRAEDLAPPTAPNSTDWHAVSAAVAAERLETDMANGLADSRAKRELLRVGPNRLAESQGRSAFAIVIGQFRNVIVLLLAVAACVSFATQEPIEGFAVLAVMLLNAFIGFVTEWRAEFALTALRRQAALRARVVRDGVEKHINAEELAPGDVVLLAAGDRIPADGRLIESVRLGIDESTLTGESEPVEKSPEPDLPAKTELGDRSNMVYMGTTAVDGRGRFIVTATGVQTEMGRIGRLVAEVRDRETPLERKLDKLGRFLVVVVAGLCAIIVAACALRGIELSRTMRIGISLAVAAVPEGLPAAATMTLAIGMERMARMRALVRRLHAVETLGSVTVICTDKTGTLTKNEMTVTAIVAGDRRFEVTGAGYSPVGEFLDPNGVPIDPRADLPLETSLRVCLLCNDSGIDRASGRDVVLGDPTEAALVVLAEKAGLVREHEERASPRVSEIPFDSRSKRMATVHRNASGGRVAYVKGSPGTLLDRGVAFLTESGTEPITPERRDRFHEWNRRLADEGLRVLGLAYRELSVDHDPAEIDRELTIVGLVGMVDPLREHVKDSIETCRSAGIRAVMITGDQLPTAERIGRLLGLDRDSQGRSLAALHASALEGRDDAEMNRIVSTTSIFARVSPEHKLNLVNALKRQGEIVAMTGDGVNDAPALKAADIGVAMGIKGTEAAKEAADMILTDDDFSTLVRAAEQGRIIYANILKFIHYLLSCNLAEILTIFSAVVVGLPLPLGALQILWLNMLTDVFPALALALEPSAPDLMKRPPRDPREELIDRRLLGLILGQSAMLAGVTLVAFLIGLNRYGLVGEGLLRAETMAFLTLGTSQIFHAFNARSRNRSIFTDRLFTNKNLWAAVVFCLGLQFAAVYFAPIRSALKTAAPTSFDWGVAAICSLAPIAIVEALKYLQRRRSRVEVR